jgi:dynein heavy chain
MSVCDAMVASLNRVMREGVLDYARREAAWAEAQGAEEEAARAEGREAKEAPGGRKVWVLSHPAQVVATVAQIMWSRETEQALKAGESGGDAVQAMVQWYDKNVAQLRHLTALVRSPLSKIARLTIVALVTTDVHARDIIEEMVEESVGASSNPCGNFKWQQQLRYYWEEKVGRDGGLGDVLVRQSNAAIPYGYEYQGATTRLVITPLTDRCWMTITGAYNLKLGAAPAGPAGTGKTESSKDLAKALGIQCIVFSAARARIAWGRPLVGPDRRRPAA